MHGIQHLFRQHALEKQASTESWHSAYGGEGASSSQTSQFAGRPPNERSRSVDDAGPPGASHEDVRHVPSALPTSFRSPTSQEYHSLGISIPRGKKSPDGRPASACMEFGGAGVKKLSKRNVTGRRGSLEGAGSPPQANHAGYFPHDLDDIYEYKTDHQYFTHTGAYDDQDERFTLASDHHRNMLFQRNQNFHSLDEYAPAANSGFNAHHLEPNNSRYLGQRNRFDNSSFVRKLASSISQSSIDSTMSHSSSTKSTDKHHKHNHHKGHHHHSIAEMIKYLGKKAHIWPGRTRHESINESTDHSPDDLSKLNQNDQEDFRKRARSLDVEKTKRILDDCESTYNIYNKILREAAHMRRASAELAERRRASLGASRGLRPDGTLDPYHAAILFRDSRGKTCEDPYEGVNNGSK
ncbi:hypothetical protein pipiens_003371 [Culex pipiens pipiens]|uniref:Uncharacterized protein n=1 Tax=Culex pipiens pipiens TaxID=38569 RepID=A0ABD1CZI1_CULPP